MKSSRYLIVGIAYLLVLSGLSGCNAGPVGNSQPTATPVVAQVPGSDEEPPAGTTEGPEATLGPGEFIDAKGLPFPVPSTQANPIVTVDREAAWGDKLSIKEVEVSVDADNVLILKAVSEDGKRIAGLVAPRRTLTFDQEYKVVLVDVVGGQMTEMESLSTEYGRDTDRVAIALDGDWMLWQAGKTLKTYNMATGARSQIETGTDSRYGIEGIYIPSTGMISVDGGVAVWAETSPGEATPEKIGSVVKKADLATGEISVIGRHGIGPVISWPNVAWIEPDVTTFVDGQMMARVVVLDLESGARRTLSRIDGFVELALHKDALVWRGWNVSAGTVFMTNLAETRRYVVAPQDSGWRRNVTLNDRLVAWGSPYGDVWDRKLGRLVRLVGRKEIAAGVIVNGHTLAWEGGTSPVEPVGPGLRPDDAKIYLLDTSQLP